MHGRAGIAWVGHEHTCSKSQIIFLQFTLGQKKPLASHCPSHLLPRPRGGDTMLEVKPLSLVGAGMMQ